MKNIGMFIWASLVAFIVFICLVIFYSTIIFIVILTAAFLLFSIILALIISGFVDLFKNKGYGLGKKRKNI